MFSTGMCSPRTLLRVREGEETKERKKDRQTDRKAKWCAYFSRVHNRQLYEPAAFRLSTRAM